MRLNDNGSRMQRLIMEKCSMTIEEKENESLFAIFFFGDERRGSRRAEKKRWYLENSWRAMMIESSSREKTKRMPRLSIWSRETLSRCWRGFRVEHEEWQFSFNEESFVKHSSIDGVTLETRMSCEKNRFRSLRRLNCSEQHRRRLSNAAWNN